MIDAVGSNKWDETPTFQKFWGCDHWSTVAATDVILGPQRRMFGVVVFFWYSCLKKTGLIALLFFVSPVAAQQYNQCK